MLQEVMQIRLLLYKISTVSISSTLTKSLFTCCCVASFSGLHVLLGTYYYTGPFCLIVLISSLFCMPEIVSLGLFLTYLD